ncbi:hypothetical protein BD311DRAFT_780689 [Dichomitus squalens]|uniref:Uncharacterized protein n=1 Tax=Dichomitus squalens TaxID=114155 RepID=A0A4Q9MC38_9APHY|nr:hypothetical protein BD311DRAFT_780689 [Dichomitus squalens]
MACGLGTETWGIRVRDRRGHCTFRTYELTPSPPHTEGRARLRSGHTSPKRHPLLSGS